MKFRKLFALLTALIMLLGMLPTASATTVNCNHDWRWKYTDESAKDCRQNNTLVYYCTICGKVDRTEKEPGPCVESDNWVWDGRAPTNCGECGIKNQLCKYCGQPVNEREEAGPHNWQNKVVREPACDWDGWKESFCTVCGEFKGDGQSIPATGHKPVTRVTESPTCTEDGLEETSCSVCDIGLGSKKLPAKGHKWGEWKTTKQRTCTEGGSETRTCSACGAKETRETKARSHNYTDFRLTKEPTCVEYGRKIGTCSRCGATVAYNVKLIDHVFGEWEIIREATPDKPGLREKKCVMCGLPIQEEFRIGEENEATNDVVNAITVEVVSMLPVYPNVGDSFVVELRVTNTGDTLLSYSSTELSHHETDACGAPVANGVNIDMLNPGESFIVPVTVNVTDADQALNYVERAFTVCMNVWANEKVGFMTPANKDTENDVSYPVNVGLTGSASITMLMQEEATETVDPDGLTVTLSNPDGSHMGYFYPGEEVPFSITVTNNTGVALTDVEITDPIKGSNEDAVVDRIISMQPGESVTVSFNYIATEADAAIGTECFENTAYATGYTADGTAINGTSNTVIVPCVIEHRLDFYKDVRNTPANGEFFVPGEVIEFCVNVGNYTGADIALPLVTDPMSTDKPECRVHPGTDCLFIDNSVDAFTHGSSYGLRVYYTVTEADAAAGSVSNTATIQYTLPNGESVTRTASATAPCGVGEPMNSAGVRLEKALRNAPANGEFYVPGEVLNYALTLRLDDGLLLDDAAIYDPIAGGDGLVISYGKGLYGGMGNDVFYVVTEEDAQRGYVENTAYATWIYQDSGEAGRCESETVIAVCGVGELPVDLSLTMGDPYGPANGTHYVLGETVRPAWTVKNNSEDRVVTLLSTTYNWNDEAPFTWSSAETLNPGSRKTRRGVTRWVTQEDVTRGYVTINVVEVCGDGENEHTLYSSLQVPCGPGELPDDYVPPVNDGSDELKDVRFTKYLLNTPANGEFFVPGEKIWFWLVFVSEDSNTEITTVEENGVYDLRVYDSLIRGQNIINEYTKKISAWATNLYYNVTEEDAQRGYVENTAYVTFSYTEGGETVRVDSNTVTAPCGPGELPDDYVPPVDPDIDGDGIPNGEDPDVDGDGIPNGEDPDVDGDGIPNGEDPDVDGDGIPNGEDPDVDGDGIPNGEDPDVDGDGIPNGEDPDVDGDGIPNGTDPDENGDGKPEDAFGVLTGMEIMKSVESLPMNGSFYTEGETVAYKITYTNSGENELINVAIYDAMSGLAEIASAEKLTPGESRTCFFNHTVTAADVARGYIANTAVGEYEVGGYSSSVNSNTVMVDTDGKEDNAAVPPLFGDDDGSNYDPSTGWTDDPAAGEDGESLFGVIDTDQLRSGETHCAITITGRDNASVGYEISFCAAHAATQASALMLKQASVTPEMQMQAASYAVALWRTEVESAYQKLLTAADPTAQAVLLTEYIRFVTDLDNYKAILNALYPDQPALVAGKIADMWQDKCVALCHEMHTLAADRKDSLLSVEAASGAVANVCGCDITLEENGKKAFTQTYCPVHGFPYSMMDMLLGGKDTAETWAMVRQIWGVELTNAYSKVAAKLGDNSAAAKAGYAVMTQWMMAREASLIALYPENPELVAQTMVKLIMDRVNNLCLTGK